MIEEDENLDGNEWGRWWCPNCDRYHDDPNYILNTCCNCGQIVSLSWTDEHGNRNAYKNGMMEPFK